MRNVVWGIVILLLLLHQDFWFWDDGRLLFGFLPIGLAYHMGLSMAAAACWYLATLYAWPEELSEAPVVAEPVKTEPGENSAGGVA